MTFHIQAITTAYEQGVGKGLDACHRMCTISSPYESGTDCHAAWRLGYAEGILQFQRKEAGLTDESLRTKWHMHGGSFKGPHFSMCTMPKHLLLPFLRAMAHGPDPAPLMEALQAAHDWMDSQADSQSKGGHATFDLMMLREQRDKIAQVLEDWKK